MRMSIEEAHDLCFRGKSNVAHAADVGCSLEELKESFRGHVAKTPIDPDVWEGDVESHGRGDSVVVRRKRFHDVLDAWYGRATIAEEYIARLGRGQGSRLQGRHDLVLREGLSHPPGQGRGPCSSGLRRPELVRSVRSGTGR